MEFFKLPKAKNINSKDRVLSMDDYLRFVLENLRYTVDIDFARKSKRDSFASVPFSLK